MEHTKYQFHFVERGEHQVKVIGCDASNMCSEVYQIVNNSFYLMKSLANRIY